MDGERKGRGCVGATAQSVEMLNCSLVVTTGMLGPERAVGRRELEGELATAWPELEVKDGLG